jgi:hypothetical protein
MRGRGVGAHEATGEHPDRRDCRDNPVRRRNIVVLEAGRVALVEEDLPPLPHGGLLLQTLATGLSPGTELTFVRGDHPGLHSEFDTELGLFQPGTRSSGYPIQRLGYMEVARVAKTRTDAFAIGDLVASTYGHATAHVSDPLHEHVVALPDDLDPILGVYVAHVGPICANGLLHAAAEVVGRTVARLGEGVEGRRVVVTGAGLIGLLTALLAHEHGAEEVAIVEEDPRRRELAEALGLLAVDADDDPALTLKTTAPMWRSNAEADRAPSQRRFGRCAPKASWWTSRSTPKEQIWCGSVRSSTTTVSPCGRRRSVAFLPAWRRSGTASACPQRPSGSYEPVATTSASTS